jgi:hypothetical protein
VLSSESLPRQIAGSAFVERAESIVFLGPSSVDKTYLAIALGFWQTRSWQEVRITRGLIWS